MSTNQYDFVRTGLLVAALSGVVAYFSQGSTSSLASLKPVTALSLAPKLCTCNDYVVRAVPGYPDNTSAIKLKSYALKEAGFVELRRPEPGAIVLYQGYTLPGIPREGHVEIVRSVSRAGVEVATSGMNIPPAQGDAGCSNVAIQMINQADISAMGASYWRKG